MNDDRDTECVACSLASGEIALSPDLGGGQRLYARRGEDGHVYRGWAVPSNHPLAPHVSEYIQAGETIRPGVRRVVERIPYTARASTGAASDAYRNGWDAVFGGRRAGGDGCNGNRAN